MDETDEMDDREEEWVHQMRREKTKTINQALDEGYLTPQPGKQRRTMTSGPRLPLRWALPACTNRCLDSSDPRQNAARSTSYTSYRQRLVLVLCRVFVRLEIRYLFTS